MKSFLFESTVRVTYFLVWAIERVGAVVVFVPLWTTHKLKWLVANIGHAIMMTLDGPRVDEVEEQAVMESEAKAVNDELSLLTTAGKIRDHAQEHGDWTDYHTEALNQIGEALLNECGWEEGAVHQYLRQVVESIEGLEYGVSDDES